MSSMVVTFNLKAILCPPFHSHVLPATGLYALLFICEWQHFVCTFVQLFSLFISCVFPPSYWFPCTYTMPSLLASFPSSSYVVFNTILPEQLRGVRFEDTKISLHIQNGVTALCLAAQCGRVALVRILLQRHSDINICCEVWTLSAWHCLILQSCTELSVWRLGLC